MTSSVTSNNSTTTTATITERTIAGKYQSSFSNPTKHVASSPRNMAYLYSSLFAGIGSGAIASMVCAPLDLLRTRMQVWGDLNVSSSGSGKGGAVSFFQQIAKEEGWRGYFRGLNATLATVPLFWGIYFPLYDDLKRTISMSQEHQLPPAAVHCISAVTAGAIADIICNPLFLIRTRLQTEGLHNAIAAQNSQSNGSPIRVKTMRETALILYREGGFPIFWRGLSASMLGLTHVGVQFPVYEWLKDQARDRRRKMTRRVGVKIEETALDVLISSGLSKMIASILTYPHEVIRSRMMDTRSSESASFSNTTKRIWRKEGFSGFYAGLPISLVRVVPNCCVTFLTYELLLRFAKKKLE